MTATLDRRTLTGLVAAMPLLAASTPTRAATDGAARPVAALLVHPDMVLLDLVGPLTVLNILGAEMHLVARRLEPCATDVGLPVMPTRSLADCPADLDVLFVPGGLKGTIAAMRDPELLALVADRGARARYVTSVCTGSLVLAAAGLLEGYRATSHWYVRDLLDRFGATVAADRVVVDRNRMTGGGVTAGLDFGLTLAALLRDEETARRIQLLLEYAPKPPFDAGEPGSAGPALADGIRKARGPLIEEARALADRHVAARR